MSTRSFARRNTWDHGAVLIFARDPDAAHLRFGITNDAAGVVVTRTGRPFFAEPALTKTLLDRLRLAVDAAGLWDRLSTDWLVLDAELLPWSAKAAELIQHQYAATGAAGTVCAQHCSTTTHGRAATRDRSRSPRGTHGRPSTARWFLHRGLPAVLLGCRRPQRYRDRPLPNPRRAGRGPSPPTSPLASRTDRRAR